MNSLIQQHDYIRCPHCSNLIASFSPECSKCGLLTSHDGIIELAEIDKRNGDALHRAQALIGFALGPAIYLLLAYILSYDVPPFSITLLFIWAVFHGLFWWKLYVWNRDFNVNDFPDDDYREALVWRNKSVAFAVLGVPPAVWLAFSIIVTG